MSDYMTRRLGNAEVARSFSLVEMPSNGIKTEAKHEAQRVRYV